MDTGDTLARRVGMKLLSERDENVRNVLVALTGSVINVGMKLLSERDENAFRQSSSGNLGYEQ